MSYRETVLKSCNPNRHGTIKLVEHRDTRVADPELIYFVEGPGFRGENAMEFVTLYEAERAYDGLVGDFTHRPNWEAQAEYDAEWGTQNGYGAHQFGREY